MVGVLIFRLVELSRRAPIQPQERQGFLELADPDSFTSLARNLHLLASPTVPDRDEGRGHPQNAHALSYFASVLQSIFDRRERCHDVFLFLIGWIEVWGVGQIEVRGG